MAGEDGMKITILLLVFLLGIYGCSQNLEESNDMDESVDRTVKDVETDIEPEDSGEGATGSSDDSSEEVEPTEGESEEYRDLNTADDVFDAIDAALSYL